MLMSGSSMRFCRLMKATSAITPIRIGTQIDSSAAPASEAFEKPSNKKPNPSAERMTETTSSEAVRLMRGDRTMKTHAQIMSTIMQMARITNKLRQPGADQEKTMQVEQRSIPLYGMRIRQRPISPILLLMALLISRSSSLVVIVLKC